MCINIYKSIYDGWNVLWIFCNLRLRRCCCTLCRVRVTLYIVRIVVKSGLGTLALMTILYIVNYLYSFCKEMKKQIFWRLILSLHFSLFLFYSGRIAQAEILHIQTLCHGYKAYWSGYCSRLPRAQVWNLRLPF